MTDNAALRILVPLDGTPLSQQALPYAQALAVTPADVILLEVLPEPEPQRGLLGNVTMSAAAVGDHASVSARAALETVADRIREEKPSANVEVALVTGHSADQILRVARALKIDLIVMATYSRNAVSRLVLGSVTDQIVKSADIPVVVVRLWDAVDGLGVVSLHRLVVPLDGSELATTALPMTERLAHQLALPVHLVTVGDERRAEVPRRIERQRASLDGRGIQVTTEILSGAPAHAIAEALRPSDLVVMASHHRAGLTAWLLRGVAERLIDHGRCPVLLTPAAPNAATPQT
ncbi:MAG: universal stress protein [Chloroflexia bacterium]|nr:universal stress protein [Chloroflexia bacterium]